MSNFETSKSQTIAGMILSFAVGFFTYPLLTFSEANCLPSKAETVLVLENMSFEMTAPITTPSGDNIWVKENQDDWFIAESGIPARSTITNVTVNCKTPSITFHEQRTFDEKADLIAVSKDIKGINVSESAIAILLLVGRCQLTEDQIPTSKPVSFA